MRTGIGTSVVAVAGLLAACGDEEVVQIVDAGQTWGPVAYKAGVYARDSLGTLQVRVEGQPGELFERQYLDAAEFANARIQVELLDGSEVVDAIELRPAEDSAGCGYDGAAAQISHEICGFDHGELRRFAISVTGGGQGCVGDWFCLPRCDAFTCGADTKCGSSFTSATLEYSRVDCVPAGDRLTGESCAWAAGADGRWIDDCAGGSTCVEGVCRAQCVDGGCPSGSTCQRIPGQSAELPACLADVLRE